MRVCDTHTSMIGYCDGWSTCNRIKLKKSRDAWCMHGDGVYVKGIIEVDELSCVKRNTAHLWPETNIV